MKKNYIVTLSCFFFLSFHLTIISQIRFTKVDPVTDIITIHNFGNTMIDISNYQICKKFQYKALNQLTLNSGTLILQAGSDVTLSNASLDVTNSDLGLYQDSNFTSTTSMLDFLQWGSSGNGRESVANAKGIWTTGNFIATTGPYFYHGNGAENGLPFWNNSVLSIEDVTFSNQTFIYPNPVNTNLNIKNNANQKILKAELFDILGKRVLMSNSSTTSISSLNLKNVAKGVYFIRLTSNLGSMSYKKVIVE